MAAKSWGELDNDRPWMDWVVYTNLIRPHVKGIKGKELIQFLIEQLKDIINLWLAWVQLE